MFRPLSETKLRLTSFSLSNFKVSTTGFIVIAVPMFLGILFVVLLYMVLDSSDRQSDREARTREALRLGNKLGSNVFDATQSIIGYSLTENQAIGDRFTSIVNETPTLFKELKENVSDDPQALQILQRQYLLQQRALTNLSAVKQSVDAGDVDASRLQKVRQGIQSEVQRAISESGQLTSVLRKSRSQERTNFSADRQMVRNILAVGLFATLVIPPLFWKLFMRSIVGRLAVSNDNAARVALRQPLHEPVVGADEIAQLDRQIHQMASELEESRKREIALLDNAADVICSINNRFEFTAVNQAATKVWKYSPEEMLGKSVIAFVPASEQEQMREVLAASFTNKVQHVFECRIVKNHGDIIELSWSVICSELDQTLFCVAHDITERKQAEQLVQESEERIRKMMGYMPVGLLVIGATDAIEYANLTFNALIGLDDSGIVGMNMRKLIVAPGRTDQSNKIAFPEDLAPSAILELIIQKSNGESFPAQISVRSFSTGGETKKLVAVRDVTEQHEVERLKREFVAVVSHELRSPLNSVMGTMCLLEAGSFGTLSAKGEALVGSTKVEIDRLIGLINDLINLEKIKAGHFNLKFATVSLSNVISSAVESIRRLAEQRNLDLSYEPEVDVLCECDRNRLVQVLVNLLSNAVKFSPANSSVRIKLTDEGDRARITVTDKGRGIPKSHLSAIFEKFTQVKGEDADKMQGSGLGLSISKSIVELHGGRIAVESTEGEGSTFWFVLPKSELTK